MKLLYDSAVRFDSFSPIYNWIYPVAGTRSRRFDRESAHILLASLSAAVSRALYVHIPFCDTICSFCPFVRSARQTAEAVESYVRALVVEIELKGRLGGLSAVPVGAVFFGGGTPSYLTPEQIVAIGDALARNFDLSGCREFSFEFEAKTATSERVEAAKRIGVTHARFGAQTFVPRYREAFTLSATVEDLETAATTLTTAFPHVSADILYGMHGQTEAELTYDIEQAVALGLANLDFYPINSIVTQRRLRQHFAKASLRPTSALTKVLMGQYVRESLKERGFLPHNGHGYVRVSQEEMHRDPVVTDEYSFVYHEHTLGYPNYDLLGFGVNAISSFSGFSIHNDSSRTSYIGQLQRGRLPLTVFEHDRVLDACRPIALALPYHGAVPLEWIDWSRIPPYVRRRVEELRQVGLLTQTAGQLALTREGWSWYANIMFYLLPEEERSALGCLISEAVQSDPTALDPSGLDGVLPQSAVHAKPAV